MHSRWYMKNKLQMLARSPMTEHDRVRLLQLAAPPKFFNWRESAEKIRELIVRLKNDIDRKENLSYQALPGYAFLALLAVEIGALRHLNSESLSCALPWDETTGMPSLPSVIADVQKFLPHTEYREDAQRLLQSFAAWTPIAEQKIACVCGSEKFQTREIVIHLMLHHVMSQEDSMVVVRQFVGVASDDDTHLRHHYNVRTPSQQYEDVQIIWDAENRIRNEVFFLLTSSYADTFNVAEFESRIKGAAAEIIQSQ